VRILLIYYNVHFGPKHHSLCLVLPNSMTNLAVLLEKYQWM